ncbi:MAG: hypothetical protein ABH871_01290 [Pseudomonadota bacterium]
MSNIVHQQVEQSDPFYTVRCLLGFPEVRSWAHEVANATTSSNAYQRVEPKDLHKAIDDPRAFSLDLSGTLRREFMHRWRAFDENWLHLPQELSTILPNKIIDGLSSIHPQPGRALGSMLVRPSVSPPLAFNAVANFAYGLMALLDPAKALEVMRNVAGYERFAGSALLDAGFRLRVGEDAELYKKIFKPLIRRGLMREAHKPEVSDEKSVYSSNLANLIDRKEDILLEFGGGQVPFGIWHDDEFDTDRTYISIDPDPKPLQNRFGRAGELPRHFASCYVGRAEDVIPFAALLPFADEVTMVAPPAEDFINMLLSGLLVVRPGKFVHVFLNAASNTNLDWLRKASFSMMDETLPSDDITLPESNHLHKYKAVRHLIIAMHYFGIPPPIHKARRYNAELEIAPIPSIGIANDCPTNPMNFTLLSAATLLPGTLNKSFTA